MGIENIVTTAQGYAPVLLLGAQIAPSRSEEMAAGAPKCSLSASGFRPSDRLVGPRFDRQSLELSAGTQPKPLLVTSLLAEGLEVDLTGPARVRFVKDAPPLAGDSPAATRTGAGEIDDL